MSTLIRRSVLRLLLAAAPAVRASAINLEVGGSAIEVILDSGFELSQKALLDWITQSARAVSGYYGKFPVSTARVRIVASDHDGVSGGKSFGYRGAMCRVSVGHHATQADLDRDWVLTHEMLHFGFPSVPDRHHWIEEGIATYVEPIARVRNGELSSGRAWSDMIRDMPQGLPGPDDRGLDNTHTWGRTYWGGAVFCLLADVGIRKSTANSKGLDSALRAINQAGGTIEVDWPLERALEIGDKATGGRTLTELYEQMRKTPVMVDLPDLWRQLGVSRRQGGVAFDDSAPLASIRKAILS